jgi:hypothetical protein
VQPATEIFESSRDYRANTPTAVAISSNNTASSPAKSDLNLLFGVLAWQAGVITESQLLVAMTQWTYNKDKPLGAILVEQSALSGTPRLPLILTYRSVCAPFVRLLSMFTRGIHHDSPNAAAVFAGSCSADRTC